jgi:hypothetical protein
VSRRSSTGDVGEPAPPSPSPGDRLRRLSRLWIVPALLGSGAAFWIGQQWGAGALDGRRRDVDRRVATYESAIETGRRQRRERRETEEALDAFGGRTLGADLETADSALRGRLNRIGEDAGLAGSLVVSTQAPRGRGTPARSEFNRSGSQRELREELDFVELPARVSVEGPLEAVMRLVHEIEREPWIKRLDAVSLDQSGGRDSDRIKLDLQLTTLFVPGREVPDEFVPPEPSDAPFDRYARLVEANPFLMPPPPKPEAAAPEAATPETRPEPRPRAPAFPYGDWRLTGLVQGPEGIEAWLRNGRTGETASIGPSGRVGAAELVEIAGDAATFRIGDESFLVLVGATLGDR